MDRPVDPLIERFRADLGLIWPEGGRLGLAISGGPDSLALLLLAQAAFPGQVEAASVDHGLRAESLAEAEFVGTICRSLGVPHEILRVNVAQGNVQQQARLARYAALSEWLSTRGVDALATAHHADDQAETLLMRLNRASGIAGLAGVRARTIVPGSEQVLLRPLLSWRRSDLAEVVQQAGITAIQDPSNTNPAFDRVRIRQALDSADWIDVLSLAASAAHMADAEEAVDWAAEREWDQAVDVAEALIQYRPDAPRAIRMRVVGRIIGELGQRARGGDIARLIAALEQGGSGNVGGVHARATKGGWTFTPEPPRRS